MTTAPSATPAETPATTPAMAQPTDRQLSLLTPSGHLSLGNLLGALRPMARHQHEAECFYGISDLHAMTVHHDPAELRTRTRELAALLLAAGLDEATLFIQSHVPTHTQLGFLLECVASTGETSRMIQYKEKSRKQSSAHDSIRVSLFTYPILMAADILLYRTAQVPVGEDQRQHVELTRDLAIRFNTTYGETFVVPEATTPPVGARVMDLADPTKKMSKSSAAEAGVIRLLDPPDVVRKKISRAVTDGDTGPDAVRRDPDKPGVTNLLEILTACGGSAEGITGYGALKKAVTDAVLAELEPLQRRYRELTEDPAHLDEVYAAGAARCIEVTAPVLAAAQNAMGVGRL